VCIGVLAGIADQSSSRAILQAIQAFVF
jgi:hypothetical protein